MNKDLEKRILEVADFIYATGYTAGSVESRPMGYEDGYKYGLNIAWKVAKTINTMDYWKLEDVFKCKPSDIYNMSASEALEKIREFENKGTCNKCVHSKCNTCVHKNEDNICCGCVDDSEYEEEHEHTEKRCIECRHHSDTHGHCLFKIDGGRCVNRDHWEPKQTEKRCEDCKNLFTDGYSTVCLIRKAACCINKDKWEPKQTEQTEEQSKQSCEDCINNNSCSLKCPEHVKANGCRRWAPKQTNDQIKLGDEVVNEAGSRGVVVGIDSEYFYLLTSNYDVPQEVTKEEYTKTGRHFSQIQELRDQLKYMITTVSIDIEKACKALILSAGSAEEVKIYENFSDEEVKDKVLEHCKRWAITECEAKETEPK